MEAWLAGYTPSGRVGRPLVFTTDHGQVRRVTARGLAVVLLRDFGTEFVACTDVVVWQVIAATEELMAQRAVRVFGLIPTAFLEFRHNVFHNVFECSGGDVIGQVEPVNIGFVLDVDESFGDGLAGTNEDRSEATNANPFGKFPNGPLFAIAGGLEERLGGRSNRIGLDVTDGGGDILVFNVGTQ